MGYKDVNRKAMLAAIACMSGTFATKDISEHQVMREAHEHLKTHSHYHAFVGKALKNLIDDSGQPLLTELQSRTKRGSIWELAGSAPQPKAPKSKPIKSKPVPVATAGNVVRSGHYDTLAYMATEEFRDIKQRMDAIPAFGGVYFRPLDSGVRMVDLHARSPKPRIGIGEGDQSLLRRGTTWLAVEASIPSRIAYLDGVRSRQKGNSRENQLEAKIISEAQANHLTMPGFPERLRFLHSQWRIDNPRKRGQLFTDLLAVDLVSRTLVLIELKREKDYSALTQVQDYLDYFRKHTDELNPFFSQLARLMGELYDCPEMAAIGRVETAKVALAAWPGWFGLKVEGLADLKRLKQAPSVAAHKPVCQTDRKRLNKPKPKQSDSSDHMGLGPQYSGDNAFTARMRHHQSWYRSEILNAPYGKGPKANSLNYYGNMLAPEASEAGANFLTPEIFRVALARLAMNIGVVERYRLLHNMLSSQPMCFNLFGPMVIDTKLATKLLQTTLPGEVKKVRGVTIEFAPEPRDEMLNDRTAFDAFIDYERTNGKLAFIGIETKLTEPFSQKHYDGPAYRRWMQTEPSIFLPDTDDKVDAIIHNQLWRDHLLVIALQVHPGSPYETGMFMLVRHPEDDACASVVAGYRELLQPMASFNDVPLDWLIKKFETAELTKAEKEWLMAFRLRYLDLESSK